MLDSLEQGKLQIAQEFDQEMIAKNLIRFSVIDRADTGATTVRGTVEVVKP